MFKVPKRLFSEDTLTGIADVFLVYTMLSPMILNIIGCYIKLTPNFIRTFLVLQGPALIATAIYLKVNGIDSVRKNKKIIFILLVLILILFVSSIKHWDSNSTRASLKFFLAYCAFGFFLGMISQIDLYRAKLLNGIWMFYIVLFLLYSIYLFSHLGYSFRLSTLPGHSSARIAALYFFFALCVLANFTLSRKTVARIAYGVIFLLSVSVASYAASRSALVIFLIIFISYLLCQIKYNVSKFHKLSFIAVAIVMCVLFSLIWLGSGNKRIKRKFSSIVDLPKQTVAYLLNNDKSAYRAVNRFPLWKDAFLKFKQKPIEGVGFGATYYHEIRKKTRVHAHNIFLQFLAETGLLGLGPFLLFLILVIKRSIESHKSLKDNDRLIFIFYPLSFMFFLLFSSTHFAIHENYFLWYFAGMIVGFDTESHQEGFS